MAEITGTYYAMTDEEYSKIATAIQEKTGKTGQILGSEFASAISEIDSNDPSYAWNSEEVVINTGAIPDYAFYNNTKIKKVTIGAGVTSIGANAFSGCTNLAEVTIGAGVTSIGANAFNKTAITEITIPEGVTSLGIQAFASNSKLATVNFNAANCTVSVDTSYSKGIFQSCAITTFNIGTTVKKIPDSFLIYSNNSGLKSITIGNSVTNIGNSAFRDCTGLTSITIPDSVTSIGDYAFQNCTGLTSVTIPDSVTSIGNYAFRDCTGLTSITIPDSVTSIGDYAFWGCTGLTSVTIPDSVTSIGISAFQSCTGLTSITIPNGVTSINSYTFFDCTGLTSVTIPDSVTSIGQYAFRDCTGLTSITIMGKPYFNNYCFQSTSKVEQLVMKGTTGVPTLSYTNCFQNSTLYNSSSTAKIYVPSNLLASYQTATNWSNATIKAKLTALQDKITIDGTEYASVYGQTWQEWCESENNTDGFVVSGNNILTADKTKFVELVNEKDTDGNITRKTPVLPTDLVIELEHITTAI